MSQTENPRARRQRSEALDARAVASVSSRPGARALRVIAGRLGRPAVVLAEEVAGAIDRTASTPVRRDAEAFLAWTGRVEDEIRAERGRRREQLRRGDPAALASAGSPAPESRTPARVLDQQLERALLNLSDGFREVIVLRLMLGLEFEAIAIRMGLASAAQAEARHGHALTRLLAEAARLASRGRAQKPPNAPAP